jgi:hypothetical protein
MVCFRYIIINTLHKSEKYNNNNNNNIESERTEVILCSYVKKLRSLFLPNSFFLIFISNDSFFISSITTLTAAIEAVSLNNLFSLGGEIKDTVDEKTRQLI